MSKVIRLELPLNMRQLSKVMYRTGVHRGWQLISSYVMQPWIQWRKPKLGARVAGKTESSLFPDKSKSCKLASDHRLANSGQTVLAKQQKQQWGLGKCVGRNILNDISFKVELQQTFQTVKYAGRNFGNVVIAEVGNFEVLKLLQYIRLYHVQSIVIQEKRTSLGESFFNFVWRVRAFAAYDSSIQIG
ncbi:hypothetical protein M513_01475 [Trichuris suis]|uniref:Uncharacterized protein n=1 Tax=Trichuris suis TaxID=68888 RepID=A0A085MKQ9_9BILA|nr:hypothetical protein M513_01475 [Trichuris suis]